MTGMIATALGSREINIDTISHNRHDSEKAIFAIATMPCTEGKIQEAIAEIEKNHPGCLLAVPKITPILVG